MNILNVLLLIAVILLFVFFLISLICFIITFYSPKRRNRNKDEIVLPPGAIYNKHRGQMALWIEQTREISHEDISIMSFDGLKLCGKFYEYTPGAPIELMMPGYRGLAERDLCAGVDRCFKLEHSTLVVEQRACGDSEGRVITFGIRESRDCLSWVEYIINRFGKDVKIILTGISMGASTVIMAGAHDVPQNVIGIIADCGYTSAPEIIKKIIKQLKLPVSILYPFVRIGAKIFGRFDINDASPIKVVGNCRVPIFFVHGEADDFVPCDMSRRNYNACKSRKKIFTVEGAGHGLSYLLSEKEYINSLSEFLYGDYVYADK